jgi:hypothetical protein
MRIKQRRGMLLLAFLERSEVKEKDQFYALWIKCISIMQSKEKRAYGIPKSWKTITESIGTLTGGPNANKKWYHRILRDKNMIASTKQGHKAQKLNITTLKKKMELLQSCFQHNCRPQNVHWKTWSAFLQRV